MRPVVGVSRRGLWCLRTALLHVASLGWATEDEIRSLVGHFTFLAPVRSELLAAFSAAHALCQRGGRQRRRLWVPVIRELRVAASLVFLARRDLSAPWCSEVSLFDVSPWCGAVVAASIPVAAVKGTARNNDRWRFSRQQEVTQLHPFSGRKDTFQSSSTSRTSAVVVTVIATDSHCHPCLTQRARSGPQVIREGWGAFLKKTHGAEETHARSPQHAQKTLCHRGYHGREISTVCKGRSSAQMAPMCRAASAHVLASFCQFAYRWVLGEWNGADLPSRDRPLHHWRPPVVSERVEPHLTPDTVGVGAVPLEQATQTGSCANTGDAQPEPQSSGCEVPLPARDRASAQPYCTVESHAPGDVAQEPIQQYGHFGRSRVLPVRVAGHPQVWSMLLHLQERGTSSKVNAYDESLLSDNPELQVYSRNSRFGARHYLFSTSVISTTAACNLLVREVRSANALGTAAHRTKFSPSFAT